MYEICYDKDYKFENYLIPFLQDNNFFLALSRYVKKLPTRDKRCQTLEVSYNHTTDEFVMWYNVDYMKSLTTWKTRGVLTHEFYHISFGHITFRAKNPSHIWNIACDLANNSIIESNAAAYKPTGVADDDSFLPEMILIPGRMPHVDFDFKSKKLTHGQKLTLKLANYIKNAPPLKSSEYYFEEIMTLMPELNNNQQIIILDTLDNHDSWANIPSELTTYVLSRQKSIIKRAVNHADSVQNGWGSIPQHISREIRNSVSDIIDWRSVLKHFSGSLIRAENTPTLKRINKRYPYIHPGISSKGGAKLLIAIDESGSVDDEMLSLFFAELRMLSKLISIETCPFDCEIDDKNIIKWNRGAVPRLNRKLEGGTNFQKPTDMFNDPKNRGRWDALMILTDGGASKPTACRGKRAWILGKNCKLLFETNELQIFMDNEKQNNSIVF